MTYTDAHLKAVLERTKVIACVGMSANPVRPSNYVGRYLGLRGYRVIPVNPGLAGQLVYGELAYGTLADIPAEAEVDMVDIFRRSDAVPAIVGEAMTHLPALRTVWMQIGVMHAGARDTAERAGLTVIEDRCPKIEHQRLFGELRKGGFNTGIISSKL